MKKTFNSCVLYLIGFPGVGKLTIANEVMRLMPFRLIDNHTINNPIFKIHRVSGVDKLPDFVWDEVGEVRKIVLRSVQKAKEDLNFIFTNALADTPEDQDVYDEIKDLASHRNACFVPVSLVCSQEENARRIALADREDNLKTTDPAAVAIFHDQYKLLPVTHEHHLTLDVTDISAAQSAQKIATHINRSMEAHV